MKKNKLYLLLGSLAVLASCGGDGGNTPWVPAVCAEDFTYSSLDGRQRKDTYTTYLSYMPTTLNYTRTMQSENGTHIANFVDGLVEHDRFGNLVPCLATNTGVANADYTEWTFTLDIANRKSVWVDVNGNEYADVKPDDFKTTLRIVLNSNTASESAYLPMLIIKGAEQYNLATSLYASVASIESENVKLTRVLNGLRAAGLADEVNNITDVRAVLDFERVGIETTETTIKYTLSQPADYFNTMLTYLPFLPLNEDYYNSLGGTLFGSERNLLFNGAYIIDERSSQKLTYKKNEKYWDADSVKTEKVDYSLLSSTVSNDFARKEFEMGNIDGFTLNSMDTEGWDIYVRGADGEGTLRDPHHDQTYSQEGQGDKSSFFFYLNQNRSTTSSSRLTVLNNSEIANANAAFKYSYIRNAIFKALDLNIYNARNGYELEEQQQYQINTYTPKYFLTDDSGKDYFDYVVDAYQEKHEVSNEEAQRALNPGSVSQPTLDESIAMAAEAVEKLATDAPNVTYPIKVEYTTLFGDQEAQYFEQMFIEATNERLNGCIIDEEYANPENSHLRVCNANDIKIQMVNNDKIVSSQSYITVSNSNDYSLFVSGWGPDYGDPMTYANTVTKGGDMAAHLGITANASLSEETDALLAEYGEMVDRANAIVSTSSSARQERYKAFAEAEVFMLDELALMRPLYQRGQGYSCSVSKFIPYRSPRSGYGLSGDKLKGLEILTDTLSGCERQRLRSEWERERAQQTTD